MRLQAAAAFLSCVGAVVPSAPAMAGTMRAAAIAATVSFLIKGPPCGGFRPYQRAWGPWVGNWVGADVRTRTPLTLPAPLGSVPADAAQFGGDVDRADRLGLRELVQHGMDDLAHVVLLVPEVVE